MYGLDGLDSKLSFLIGKEVIQIAIGVHDVQIRYQNGTISIWSSFIFETPDGKKCRWIAGKPETAKELVALLQSTIINVKCSKTDLTIRFANGSELMLGDPDLQFESFSISEEKQPLIVV
jgi:hypothetical protein